METSKSQVSETDSINLSGQAQSKPLGTNDSLIISLSQIDLFIIKKLYVENYTSGVLSKGAVSNLSDDWSSNGFYGVYYFTNVDYKMPYIAKAVISKKQIDWIYENNSEHLLEFTTFENELNPFVELVSIGEGRPVVLKIFGDPQRISGNNYMYFDQFGNGVTFAFSENALKAIRVGRYVDVNRVDLVVLK